MNGSNAALLALAVVSLAALAGGHRTSPPAADDSQVAAQDLQVTEQDYWNALAAWADAGRMENTDEIVRTAESLKQMGCLKDLSRLDPLRAKAGPITKAITDSLRK